MDTAWKNIEICLCFRGIMLQKIWVDDTGCTEKITFIGEDEHRVWYLTAAVIRYMLAFIGEFMQNIIHVTDFSNIRDKIALKLIHYERNKILLKDVPHIRFLDLAIVFYCLISMDITQGSATILIHHSHLKNWNMQTDDLFEIAKKNTQQILPEKLYDMNDVGKVCEKRGINISGWPVILIIP